MYLSVIYCILVWQAGTKPRSKEEDDEDDADNGKDDVGQINVF